jgi:hypothetical protein
VSAKKLGVFVNLKDFKGNINEALIKMIKYLKNFGINIAKNFRR